MFIFGYRTNLARLDADYPVSHGGQSRVVGDDNHGHAMLPALILQQLQDFLAGVVVQRTGGLIA